MSNLIVPTYAEIPRIPQRWLWYPWIPRDVMVLLAGKAGSLKGTSMAELIARISRGWTWPDGSPGLPAGDIIAITPEDRANESMAYRLYAANADVSRVWNFTKVRMLSGAEKAWKLDEYGLAELQQFAAQVPALGTERYGRPGSVRMIYIDPMLAVIDNKQVATNAAARANVVDPLDALAKQFGSAVALVNHTVKDGSIAGSQGLVDAARLTLMFSPVRGAAGVKQLAVFKSNIGPDGEQVEPMRYRQTGETDETRTVEWLRAAQSIPEAPESYRTLRLVQSAPEPAQAQPTARELFQQIRRNVGSVTR